MNLDQTSWKMIYINKVDNNLYAYIKFNVEHQSYLGKSMAKFKQKYGKCIAKLCQKN